MKAVKPRRNNVDIFFQLTRRHLSVYFKNKIVVFYTLLVPVIIFVVYILFLRNLELSTVDSILMDDTIVPGGITKTPELESYIQCMIDSWMLSGITAICTFSVSMQTNSLIVRDKETGVNRDFISSPINSSVLIASYFLYNFLVTYIICLVFVFICFIYLAALGEFLMNGISFITILGVLALATVVSTLFTTFICSFTKHENTLISINAIFSTALGFIIGAYMPFSQLPKWVQNVCLFFPGTYTCSMFRYAFLSVPISGMSDYVVANFAQGSEIMSALFENFGFSLEFFGTEVGTGFQSLAVIIFCAILLVLNIFSGRKLVTVLGTMNKKGKERRKERRAKRAAAAVAASSANAAEVTKDPAEDIAGDGTTSAGTETDTMSAGAVGTDAGTSGPGADNGGA